MPKKSKKDATPTLNRRNFLSTTLAVGASSAIAYALPGVETEQKEGLKGGPPAHPQFDLEELTIPDLQAGMKSGKYSALFLTMMYQHRIAYLDKGATGVHSILEMNPDALAIAESLDAERKAKGPRGPLHGIPVLIKDNIDTADKMMTTAGSLALMGSIAQRDAFVVQKLREAGAVLLGKTNLSEWANIRSSHSSSGWSGRGGQTRNPYALDRNPCGSSSGTGAAVSANFCSVGIGTETDGSIVCPSSANGLVGIKPTLGLLSRAGIIPIAHSQDTPGPMARTVTDVAILLGALAGTDVNDSATMDSRSKVSTDYTQFLDRAGLKNARIGVVRKSFGFSDAVDQLMESALEAMKHEGAVLIDPVEFDAEMKLDDAELEVLLYELKADLNDYLGKLGPKVAVHSLKDIIDFNEKNKIKEMKYFGQDLFVKAQEKGPLTSKDYIDALAKCRTLSREKGIDALMAKHNLDALIAPTGGPAWLTDLATGDHFSGGSSTPAAVAGYPNINVPAGHSFGLPVGISFFGRAYSEQKLIKIAYAFEQATTLRKPPRFLPTVEL